MKIFSKIKALIRLQRIKSHQRARVLVNQLSADYGRAKTEKEKNEVVRRFVMINL